MSASGEPEKGDRYSAPASLQKLVEGDTLSEAAGALVDG
jgi:hypothetical protein